MVNHEEVFRYFQNKLEELNKQYKFGILEFNPCLIKSREDIKQYVRKMTSCLFSDGEVYFLNDNQSNQEEADYLDFRFNNELFRLKIDPKFGHIELDYSRVENSLAQLTGKTITTINPTGYTVVGKKHFMVQAWNKGFPFHLPTIDFLNYNLNGNRFKRSELEYNFILNRRIDAKTYAKTILKGLNHYLEKRGKQLKYSTHQIRTYSNNDHKSISVSINGDYNGGFQLLNDNTIFKNGFINQLFLLNYLDVETEATIFLEEAEEKNRKIIHLFSEYLLGLGEDDLKR